MAEQKDMRLGALRRFAIAITVLNVLGHTVLGFEQSLAQPRYGRARRLRHRDPARARRAWRLGRTPPLPGRRHRLRRLPALGPHHRPRGRHAALRQRAAAGRSPSPRPSRSARSTCSGRAPTAHAATSSTRRTSGSRPRCSPSPGSASRRPTSSPRTSPAPATGSCRPSSSSPARSSTRKFTGRIPLIVAWLGGFVVQAVIRHFAFGTPLPAVAASR